MHIHDISGSSISNNITSYTFNNTFNYKDSFNGDHINTGRGGGAAAGIATLIVLALAVGVGYLLIQNVGIIALIAGGTYGAYRLDKAVFPDRQPNFLEVK